MSAAVLPVQEYDGFASEAEARRIKDPGIGGTINLDGRSGCFGYFAGSGDITLPKNVPAGVTLTVYVTGGSGINFRNTAGAVRLAAGTGEGGIITSVGNNEWRGLKFDAAA